MRALLPLLFLAACTPEKPAPTGDPDIDVDGFPASEDCDDGDARRFPGNAETCDGLDNDCDDTVDEDVAGAPTWYADADADGYGDAAVTTTACDAPAGHVANPDDCDDTAAAVHPDAVEDDCTDPVDYNCDGSVGFADVDGDGTPACEDCDDGDELRHPGAAEVCDEADVDEDCSGAADDADPGVTGATTWYADTDGDAYGDGMTAVAACDAPAGHVADGTDCDDTNAQVNPGAAETDCADPTDYNCDGSVGFADGDGDGAPACDDCDDGDPLRNPAATEVCDPADVDEDCNGAADDADPGASGTSPWYGDDDRDGFGDPSVIALACDAPAHHVADATDCDDDSAAVNPAAAEVCDAADIDEDCSGAADDADPGATGAVTWYADTDSDGFGDASSVTTACDAPSGYVSDATDCDDRAVAVNPAASEVCDAADTDEDCDGLADDDDVAGGAVSGHLDDDGDGYGSAAVVTGCELGAVVATGDDCDDTDAAVNPGASERCATAADDDCDGAANEAGASDCDTWHLDADGDGYGTASTVCTCSSTGAYTATDADDCDDGAATTSPSGAEVCGDGVDQDCSGADETCASSRFSGTDSADDAYDGRFSGLDASDGFGGSLVVGDFDGDGETDLLIGAQQGEASAAYTNHGVVYGFYGPLPTGEVYAGDADVSYANETSSAWSSWGGTGVYNVGDLDEDGADDLLVSTTGTAAALFYGGGTGAISSASLDRELTCGAAAPAGNVDGTRTSALVCGDTSYASDAGAALVYPDGTTASSDLVVGESANDFAGSSVAGGSDLDGDGVDDLWVGARLEDSGASDAGAAYLVLGPVTGTTSLADAEAKVLGSAMSDYLGHHVKMPGDLDGDGAPDLLVGASHADYGDSDVGAAYLFTTRPSGTVSATSAEATIYGEDAGDLLTHAGAYDVGDVDGDGTLDLFFGAYGNADAAADAGSAWLVYGPVSGTMTVGSADADWLGVSASDGFGVSAVVLPDLDGDGRDEIAAGAQLGDGDVTDAGAVWLWLGR